MEDPKISILVVEDSHTQALSLIHLLQQNGFNADLVENGVAALERVELLKPDVVITDIYMEEMNGYELCSKIKGNESTREIPVILITALSDAEDIINSMQAGGDCFLTKPYNEALIVSSINNLTAEENKLLPGDYEKMTFALTFSGTIYQIEASPRQATRLLLSTYENAAHKSEELAQTLDELKKVQRELKRSQKDELEKQRNYFLSIVSHDLRNPISIIAEFTSLILDLHSEGLSDEVLDMLKRISANSSHTLSMLTNLLDLSVIESGKMKLEYEDTSLIELLQNAVLNAEVIAGRKQISMSYTPPKEFPAVPVDPAKFRQVIDNIISNSIKYSFPETTITVSLELKNNHPLILIEDQGQGMDEDKISKLFTPFESKGTGGTSGEKSTGLGLTIVHKIVTLHKGRLWVESEPGKGSKFFVELPKLHQSEEAKTGTDN